MVYNKNYLYIFIFILIILLTIIYLEFNTTFILIGNIPKIINKDKGILFIGTHNNEHKDIFITFKQFEKIDKHFYMLFANKEWNHLLEPFRPKNIEFIYVKEKTVECISSKLLLGKNVIMFLYNESTSTGPFYIIKNTKCPLVILKIKKDMNDKSIINHFNGSFKDIYVNNFMSKFSLEFKKIKYNLSKFTNCNLFMKELKYYLYN